MEAFARSAREGLDGTEPMERAISRLRDIAAEDHKEIRPWTHAPWAPIRTNVSDGAFMPDANGGLKLVGRVTFIWDIRNVGPKRRLTPFKYFELVGIASTKIELLRIKPNLTEDVIAMWRIEVASDDAPAATFIRRFSATMI